MHNNSEIYILCDILKKNEIMKQIMQTLVNFLKDSKKNFWNAAQKLYIVCDLSLQPYWKPVGFFLIWVVNALLAYSIYLDYLEVLKIQALVAHEASLIEDIRETISIIEAIEKYTGRSMVDEWEALLKRQKDFEKIFDVSVKKKP